MSGTPLLRAAGLTRRFGDVTAVDNVDLAIHSGDRHAAIGANGAGKTTLLHLLAGTIRPTTGTICWQGRDVTRTGQDKRARAGIARTFQTPTVLASMSTVDNLVLGAWPHIHTRRPWWPPARYRQIRAAAVEQLHDVGLADHADTPASALSHGQRRLLDIAIALAGDPQLLLLDEPAAGLDSPDDLDRLLRLLAALPTSMAVVLVEHHLDLVAAAATTVTVLDHGHVLATGSHDRILTDPAVRAAYPGLTGGPAHAAR